MTADEGRPRARRWAAVAVAGGLVAGLGWLAASSLRRPAETVVTPEVDAYVSTAHPAANYGMAPTLRADASPRIRSYLRFRLDGLSGRRVVRARLRLWSRSGDLDGYTVRPVAGASWDEHAITSDNGPPPGQPAASSGPFGPGTWASTDVTRLVHQGNGRLSVALTTGSDQNITFDSREGPYRPQLVVEMATD